MKEAGAGRQRNSSLAQEAAAEAAAAAAAVRISVACGYSAGVGGLALAAAGGHPAHLHQKLRC